MSSHPADFIAEKASLEPLGTLHMPEVIDLVGDMRNQQNRPLILVSGPSGVGKSALVESGLESLIARESRNLRKILIQIQLADTPTSLITQCIREIWRHHPDLNHHIVTRSQIACKQRKSLFELAENDPVKAGKQLFTILRGVERGRTGSRLHDIRLLLHLEGIEKLYEHNVGVGRDSFPPAFGPETDPFGFIRELMRSASIQIVITSRNWVKKSIHHGLQQSRIQPTAILDCELDWPAESRIVSALNRAYSKPEAGYGGKKASSRAEKLAEQISDASPACVQHLSGLIAKAASGKTTLPEYLSSIAEDCFQSLDDNLRGSVKRLVHRISKGGGALPAREVSGDPHLWKVANGMTNRGILCLTGNSLDDARFSLVAQDLFQSWERANRWMEEDNAPSHNIQQADQFENHALSWDSTGRTKDLLLHVDTSIEKARELLTAHNKKPILSPLAFEFLQASVSAADSKIGARLAIIKKFALTAGAGIAAVLIITGMIHYSESADPEATPVAKVSPALPSAPELAVVPAVDAGNSETESTEEPAEVAVVAEPEEQTPAPFPPPEGLFEDSSLETILLKVEADLASQQLGESLAAIRFFHDRALDSEVPRPKSSQLHRLTVALGKIALLQGDQKGAEFGWQLGLGGSKRSNLKIPSGLKLLMARTEANAGRIDDAAAILFGTGNRSSLSPAVKPILDFEFSSIDPASLPELDTSVVDILPVSKKAKAALLGN